MTTIRLDVAYDGAGFRGYAKQDGMRTVQGELESALEAVLGAPVATAAAGRTDAGAHALGQVVSFSTDADVVAERLGRSVNGIVGPEISVMAASVAPDGFNARFSASWRRYRYLIGIGPAPDPLTRHVVWHVDRVLDVGAMRRIAEALVGEHDFSSFCKKTEGSAVRRVEEAEWREGPGRLELWIRANAFCRQMVRSVVGYCYDVGRGFSDPSGAADVIAARDRSAVATVAPPHGLTLWEVGYA